MYDTFLWTVSYHLISGCVVFFFRDDKRNLAMVLETRRNKKKRFLNGVLWPAKDDDADVLSREVSHHPPGNYGTLLFRGITYI